MIPIILFSFQLIRDREAAPSSLEDEHPFLCDGPAAGGHEAERAHVAAHRHSQHHQRGAGQCITQVIEIKSFFAISFLAANSKHKEKVRLGYSMIAWLDAMVYLSGAQSSS